MKKTELVRIVSYTSGETQETVKRVLDTLIDEIAESLKDGEYINLTGLGKFYTTTFKARTQRDPQGREITIPEHLAPRFKYSPTLKRVITNAQ